MNLVSRGVLEQFCNRKDIKLQFIYTLKNFLVYTNETLVGSKILLIVGSTAKFR